MDFDEVLNLEEKFYDEGFKEGQTVSTQQSFLEGKEYGMQVGFQKFVFLGQVRAVVDMIQGESFALSGQAEGHLYQLVQYLDSIRLSNEYGCVVKNEKTIARIRNKLRILLNILPELKELGLSVMDNTADVLSGLQEDKSQQSIGTLINDEGLW